jgi:hypothetical protein
MVSFVLSSPMTAPILISQHSYSHPAVRLRGSLEGTFIDTSFPRFVVSAFSKRVDGAKTFCAKWICFAYI